MRRAVSTLRVADPGLWATLSEELDLDAHLGPALSEVERVALPSFVTEVLPGLEERILVRYARRDATEAAERAEAWRAVVADLPSRTRRVLHTAQRHAHEGVVLGLNAWDPHLDAAHVRALHGAGLIESVGDEALPYAGRYRLAEDLPAPPAVSLDLSEAVMEETDDLSEPEPGPGRILHDAAGLAAALDHVGPRRTHKDVLSKVDVRRLAKRLGDPGLAEQGALETHPRWGLALRALEALGAVSMDAFSRQLHLDLGLEGILQGETTDAIGRFAHKVLDRDLHPLLPAIREGLRQAGDGALDEVIFSDLLREQWREVLFAPWAREGLEVYPLLPGERLRLYHDDAWDRVEARALDRALRRLQRIGLVRRAPGVFAATVDGRQWAAAHDGPHPPIWVSSDLEIIVPPAAVTAWERFQLERLCSCLSRDVTDRYRLERAGLRKWLETHDVEEAVAVLLRRAPGVPRGVVDTLRAWARGELQVVLTHGIIVDDAELVEAALADR